MKTYMHSSIVLNIYREKSFKQTPKNENKSSVMFEILTTVTIKTIKIGFRSDRGSTLLRIIGKHIQITRNRVPEMFIKTYRLVPSLVAI
jgi:hypothetical protein